MAVPDRGGLLGPRADRQQARGQVARGEAAPGGRNEGGGTDRDQALPAPDAPPLDALVCPQRREGVIGRRAERIGERRRAGHGHARSIAEQRRAGRGVADQHRSALGPAVESNPAHGVEVEVVGQRHLLEQLWDAPAPAGEGVADKRPVLSDVVVVEAADQLAAEEERGDGPAAGGVYGDGTTGGVVHHDCAFVVLRVAEHGGGDVETEVSDVAVFRAERELAHPRVQPIGAHDQIEAPRRRVLERDVDAVAVVTQRNDGVAVAEVGVAASRVGQHSGEVAAGQLDLVVP